MQGPCSVNIKFCVLLQSLRFLDAWCPFDFFWPFEELERQIIGSFPFLFSHPKTLEQPYSTRDYDFSPILRLTMGKWSFGKKGYFWTEIQANRNGRPTPIVWFPSSILISTPSSFMLKFIKNILINKKMVTVKSRFNGTCFSHFASEQAGNVEKSLANLDLRWS